MAVDPNRARPNVSDFDVAGIKSDLEDSARHFAEKVGEETGQDPDEIMKNARLND